MVRAGADDPIATTVVPITYAHGEACAHGRRWVSVDGERWHQDGRTPSGHECWWPCDPQLELLPKRKVAR